MGTGGAAWTVWSEHSSGGGQARVFSELSKGPFAVRSIVGWGILLYPVIGVYYYYLYDWSVKSDWSETLQVAGVSTGSRSPVLTVAGCWPWNPAETSYESRGVNMPTFLWVRRKAALVIFDATGSFSPTPNFLPLLIVVHVVTFANNLTQTQTAILSRCRQTLFFLSLKEDFHFWDFKKVQKYCKGCR